MPRKLNEFLFIFRRMQGPGMLKPWGQLCQLLGRHVPLKPPQREPDVEVENPGRAWNEGPVDNRKCQKVKREIASVCLLIQMGIFKNSVDIKSQDIQITFNQLF